MSTLRSWLRRHQLEELAEVFAANDVDVDVVGDLTEADLTDLGLSVGQRRRLRKAVATDPPLASPAASSCDAQQTSGPERRLLTVMFVDLVGSKELSRRLDPEDMREVLKSYQNSVAGEISRRQGVVAKYMGDGVLAYFGWPATHEDEAARAVRVGLSVVEAVARLETVAGVPLACRVGIATGVVIVGDLIGSGSAEEASVVGETPNLASRLQAVAAPGGIVVSSTTAKLLGRAFHLAELTNPTLRGFEDASKAYRVEAERVSPDRFTAKVGPTRAAIVGRTEDLRQLSAAFDRACAGAGQTILVVGEAGIGKSRLIRAFNDHHATTPHRRVMLQCSPDETRTSLWPIRQNLRQAAAISAGDDPSTKAHKLARLFPHLAARADDFALVGALIGIDAPVASAVRHLEPRIRRDRTLRALLDLTFDTTAEEPLVLILEDAHWADPTTVEYAERLLHGLQDSRIFFIVTARPDGPGALMQHDGVARLQLERLPSADLQTLITGMTGAAKLTENEIRTIAKRSDGVPLFAEELTRAVLEAETGLDQVPESLNDTLMARLDALPHARSVAQAAACIGREFDLDLLGKVAERERPAVIQALDALQDSGLVYRRAGDGSDVYLFKHALVRDAAASTLLTAERRAVHRRIAECLSDVDAGSSLELIAAHAEAAGMDAMARRYWREAGEAAVRA